MPTSSSTSVVFNSIELPSEIARQRVVDERTAAQFIGLAPISLERLRKAGTAPRHIQLTQRRLGYRVCDLLAWLDKRVAASGEAD